MKMHHAYKVKIWNQVIRATENISIPLLKEGNKTK